MKEALDKLVRLAELRRGIAERAVRAARDAKTDAEAARDALIVEMDSLEAKQNALAEKLRSPMVGSPQIQGALGAVLQTFQADRYRLQEARAGIAQAEDAITQADAALEEARANLVAALRGYQKRVELRAPVLEAHAYALEMRDDLEAEDRRYTLPGGFS